ncbi:hypothetical protein BZK31_01080 [Pseudomonas floridensis]|uniref:Uncharacterized protein n=1 Tax=Pseudomonas floridensis TaxID=1958950 RepID=A0A1X0NCH0_9PSED|nr:hypothetical protein [Pseudomonas floridensis]ORC62261.1 hypothetical protein BZK31_01080 [Pseudomonas floridensis]
MSAQIDPYRLPALAHYLSGLVFADRATPQHPLPLYTFVGHYNAALEWVALDDFIDTVRTEGITAEGFSAFWVIPPAGAPEEGNPRNTESSAGENGRGQFTDCLTLTEVYGDWISSTRYTPLSVDTDY